MQTKSSFGQYRAVQTTIWIQLWLILAFMSYLGFIYTGWFPGLCFPHPGNTSLILSLKKIYLSRLPKKRKRSSPKPTDQRRSQGTEEILLPSPTQADSGREINHLTFRQKIVKHFLPIHDKVVLGPAGMFIAVFFLQKCCRWKIANRQWEGKSQRFWFATSGPANASCNFPGNVWHCIHSKRKPKLSTDFPY